MRFVYMDEAGISRDEPVAVVAGVIVHADKQWKKLEQHLADVAERHIPAEVRQDFIFHAKDIFAAKKPPFDDRDEWPLDRRLNVIEDLLNARVGLGFSVCIGYEFNQPGRHTNKAEYTTRRHLMAYSACVLGCERFMREFAEEDEVALVVAEDTPAVRTRIKNLHDDIVSKSPKFPAYKELLPIRHIVDTVHFAEKKRSPLLQYADACAFAFRRKFCGYDYGDRLIAALSGPLAIGNIEPTGNGGFKLLSSVLVQKTQSDRGGAATG